MPECVPETSQNIVVSPIGNFGVAVTTLDDAAELRRSKHLTSGAKITSCHGESQVQHKGQEMGLDAPAVVVELRGAHQVHRENIWSHLVRKVVGHTDQP